MDIRLFTGIVAIERGSPRTIDPSHDTVIIPTVTRIESGDPHPLYQKIITRGRSHYLFVETHQFYIFFLETLVNRFKHLDSVGCVAVDADAIR